MDCQRGYEPDFKSWFKPSRFVFRAPHRTTPLKLAGVVEEQTGKPLIVLLDQVEELYSRPVAGLPNEMGLFLAAIKATFVTCNQRPRGKLVLGFRKEWLAELETQLDDYELPRTRMFLKPLDRRGIIDVVQGPVQADRLREQYCLTVQEGLGEIVADDLLTDLAGANRVQQLDGYHRRVLPLLDGNRQTIERVRQRYFQSRDLEFAFNDLRLDARAIRSRMKTPSEVGQKPRKATWPVGWGRNPHGLHPSL